jgi:peptidoglycan/LPS O-acetylase OafA/YrhL
MTPRDRGETYPYPEFQRQPYFDALDGLRALSILLVLLHHASAYEAGVLETLRENGRYGVAFFFVISGFLIATLLRRERDENGRIALARFYGRRALRLLPLYYVALALQAVLVFGLHQYTPQNQELFRAKLPGYLFYFSNWFPDATNGPFFCAWSLAVEEQFYLGFGLLLAFARSVRGVAAGLIVLLVAKFAVYEALGQVDTFATVWRVLFSYQEPIIWGVLAAFALRSPRWYGLARAALGGRGVAVGLGAAIAGWLCFHPMASQSTWDAELLYVLMTALLVALVIRRRTPLINQPALVHVGRVSYGIYLLHMFVISAVRRLPHGSDPAVCFLLATAIVIPLASGVYRYFESPIIRYYKRRFAPTPGPVPAPATQPLRASDSAPAP